MVILISHIGVENLNFFEWRKVKCRLFDHNARDAGILYDESAGEHPTALDTVISRTLARCHFERSGSGVEKSRFPPSLVALESVPNATVAGAILRSASST